MSQNQKTKNRRSLSKDRVVSSLKKTATPYTLELLESRVLLSADLAGAVQAAPIKADVPQQTVVLHVQAPATAGQQTFSVSEMLAKPASSFPQGVNVAGQAISHGNEPSAGQVAASSQPSSQDTRTAPEILGQQSQTKTELSSQSNAGSQSQVASLTSSPKPTLSQSIATPVMTTLQNEQALPPTAQQDQQTLTDAQILALQTQQPVTQSPTQQTVVSPGITLPSEKNDGTSVPSTVQPPVVQQNQQPLTNAGILALQTQQPITQVPTQQSVVSPSQPLSQQSSSINQSSEAQTQSVSQGLISAPLNQTTPISTTITGSSTTSATINPQLPQATVDTSMPTTTVTVRVGPHGDYTDLQTALNNVSLGTTILLEPGVSYTSTNETGFILPNKTTGTGWIVIRPDVPDSALPAPGTRITPADSAMMPKIVRGFGNLYAMSSEPSAHHYHIMGVEFMNQGNADTPRSGAFINIDSREGSLSSQTNHIIFDRVYVHGPSTPNVLGVKFGIVLGGQHEAVIDSYIEELVSQDGESKAIGVWDGAGPIKIENNFLSAAGENIMIGGADPVISGLVPSDIEIRNNHFFKPLKWRDDPAYASPSSVNYVGTKNLLELKNAQRVVVDGNIFENVWYPNNQSAFAIMISPRNQDGTAPWSVVQDLTFTNNKIVGTANGIAVGGFDSHWQIGMPSEHGGRMLFQDNVIVNLGTAPSIDINGGTGKFFLISFGVSHLHIIHNTVMSYAGTIGNDFTFTYGISDEGGLFPLQGLIIKDNVLQHAGNATLVAGAPLATVAPGAILS